MPRGVEISVIVTCYNQEKYIAECLKSLESQYIKNFEVIIVNDGSTDGSIKIIAEYVDKYKNFHLINQKNKGVVLSRNEAIKKARGKYIYPLDADDKIAPTTLKEAYEAIENKKGDIITSKVELFGQKTGEMILPCPNKINLSRKNCLVSAALFRKRDFIKCGGYDKKFNHGLEDYDLWLNMVFNYNLKIYRIPHILFFYRIKQIEESRNLQQIKKYGKRMRLLIKKKYPQLKTYKLLYKIKNFIFRYSNKENKLNIRLLGITFKYKYN